MNASTQRSHQPARPVATERDLIRLHAQACNGLNAALHLLTNTSTQATDAAVFTQALARATRAATALKQACAELKGGAA